MMSFVEYLMTDPSLYLGGFLLFAALVYTLSASERGLHFYKNSYTSSFL